MNELLLEIQARLETALGEAQDNAALEALRVRLLGKKGEITQVLKSLGGLAPEERRELGQKAHALREKVERGLEDMRAFILAKQQASQLETETLDVTLPGRKRAVGHRHPLTTVTRRMEDFFIGLGFTVAEGPHIETEYYNFEALNTPKHHSSRDEQDTFYIGESHVLRTHTSPVQVRTMERQRPPIRVIAPGKVFRADEADATHTPVFHQMEGLVIDRGITLGHMKGLLEMFCQYMFGPETRIRLRPSYFPFTEPSAEVDATCYACHGDIPDAGCPVCKDSGWLELWGCGMVHPQVLRMSGIDPDEYAGYAFGMGIDRIASMLYGVNDPRLYFENDTEFLSQF